jgi:hypothetical protein
MSPSSLVLRPSDLQKNVLTILRGLARTLLSNLSLLTSPLLIAELHTGDVHGLFEEPKLSGRLFLCVDDGMSEVLNSICWFYRYLDSLFCLHFHFPMGLGIVRGNPGVFQLYPYPYPWNPYPPSRVGVLEGWGKGFWKPWGLLHCQGYPSNFM